MNTSLTAYTHLESLLLFQSLHAHGITPPVFSRISELLKNNPHITGDKRFQSGRLSPDALRNFYLHILKEEIKSEQAIDGDSSNGPNGEIKNSRKRKAPSPSLPTVQESVQHQHLIPKLVNKLYARYRAAITDQIRHDEDRYEKLQKELQGIERGEWDNQLKEKINGTTTSASRSPSLPKKSPLLPQQALPSKASPQPAKSDTTLNGTPPDSTSTPDGSQQQPLEPSKALPSQNGQPPAKSTPSASLRKKQAPVDQRSTPATPQPLPGNVPSPQQNQTPQPLAIPPGYQAQPPPNSGFNGAPPSNRSPFPPQAQQIQAAQSVSPGSPLAPTQGHPPHPQAGTPGAQLQPQPIQPFGGNSVPPYGTLPGAPPQYSPTHQRFPGPQSPSVQTPQQQRHYISYPGQPPYPPQQPQMGHPPPQGGFMLPPFQVSPQDPSRAHQQPPPPPQYPQVSTPVSARQPSAKATPQTGGAIRPGVPPMHPLVTQARHSFSTPTGIRTPQSGISTPRSAKTVWKASAKTFSTPPVPRPEVSPLDDLGPSESLQQSPPKTKSTRRTRAKGKTKEKEPDKEVEAEPQPEPEQPSEEVVPEIETRQGRSRRKAPAKRIRPGSIASSQAGTSVRERSRSHSILSHTETVAADSDAQAGGRIKIERGTSVDAVEEDSAATPTHMSTRRRAGGLPASQPSNKRKRNVREPSPEEVEEQSDSPGLPKTVVAPRHFSRMCAPLMNDIGSHKHASTFTTAVKAKDAEGYYDIIKRPTDLKTIQKAIAVGAKQVAASASGDTPAGSPGGGGGVVELPLTAENIPPKAIVNSSQLEKELMRMFVNAVMFNAGDEGVVEDARQMFESVQLSVSRWRSVERSSGRLEVEETPPVQEEEVPVASKRRKL